MGERGVAAGQPVVDDSHLRAWVSAGQAFRAPALGELYYPYAGNPALEAEHSRSAEAGVVVPLSDRLASTQLVVFANRTEDLIDFDFASFRYVNAGHAEQRGVEASFNQQLGHGGTGAAGGRPGWTRSATTAAVAARPRVVRLGHARPRAGPRRRRRGLVGLGGGAAGHRPE